MLRSLRQVIGYRMRALDGELGQAEDFYFDDQYWTIRYLVADLEKSSRSEVLIPPIHVQEPDREQRMIPVTLTKQQIEQSPAVEYDLPVSRQQEVRLATYYNRTPWWLEPGLPPLGLPAMSLGGIIDEEKRFRTDQGKGSGDPHLRSVNEVTSYYLTTKGGDRGQITDFIVHMDEWTVKYLVIRTNPWPYKREVLVSPAWLERVDWAERRVHTELSAEQIKNSPVFDSSVPINRDYEGRLYDFYGRPKYWVADPASKSATGSPGRSVQVSDS